MNTADKKALVFFCNAYDELRELSTAQLSDYKINHISRILRQFLFDSKSIISTAANIALPKNGEFTFTCSPYEPLNAPGLEFGSVQDGFHPEPDMPFGSPINITRRELGNQSLFEYKGNVFTVKQLVKYIANKEGSVHFDQTELDVSEIEMREAQDYLNVGGRAALTSMLRSVALVVLDGLADLRKNSEKLFKQS